MRTRALSIVLFLVTAALQAQQLVITKKGCFVLTQDANGVPVLTDLKIKPDKIIDLRDSSAPVPTPNPTDPVATHRATVQTATDKVVDANKTNTKLALSKLYQTVSGLPVTSREQLVQSTDLLFNALNLPAVWKTWKAEVDKSLLSFVAVDDAKKAWQIVAEVLAKASATDGDGTVIVTPENMDAVLQKMHKSQGR